ncbi:unnamed protein product, partial [Closterium sp. NIES-54]
MDPSSNPPPLLHPSPPILPPFDVSGAPSAPSPVAAPLATTATTAATTTSSTSSSTSTRREGEHARGVAAAVTARQVESLERILRSAADMLKEMAKVAAALQKLTRDADRVGAALQPRPTEDERSRRLGMHASLAETCGGLRLVADSYCNELRLKQQLVAAITYNTCPSDMAAIVAVLEDEPCIDSLQ